MCFNFHHLKVDYKNGDKWALMPADHLALKKLFQTCQEGMQAHDGWNALFWCNHDQPRAVSRFGSDTAYWKQSAKMLATAIHFMRGTPYIYQGEELGMTNTTSYQAVGIYARGPTEVDDDITFRRVMKGSRFSMKKVGRSADTTSCFFQTQE